MSRLRLNANSSFIFDVYIYASTIEENHAPTLKQSITSLRALSLAKPHYPP